MIEQIKGKEFEIFLNFSKEFVRLLSLEKYHECLKLIDDKSDNGPDWTEELLKGIFDFYKEDDPDFKIDNPFEVECKTVIKYNNGSAYNRASIYEYNNGSGYAFEYDLTTNGELNDLTIMFEFIKRNNNYVVLLEDIHVL